MDDQGEKIVFLAREILNAGIAEQPPVKRRSDVTMSFMALCLTTTLAAGSGALAAHTLHAAERPLNRYEKTEINALVFYASKLKGIGEADLSREVAAKIGVARLDDMTAEDFSKARKLLQEKAQN